MTATAQETLVLMACSATKAETSKAIPLHELYQGPMWQTLRTHRGVISWEQVVVLSGKYGIVSSGVYSAGYEEKISAKKVDGILERGLNRVVYKNRGGIEHEAIGGKFIRPGEGRYRRVIIAGAGEYKRCFLGLVEQLQAGGHVAQDAEVLVVAGGIGQQRGQLGEFLRKANEVVAPPEPPKPVRSAQDLREAELRAERMLHKLSSGERQAAKNHERNALKADQLRLPLDEPAQPARKAQPAYHGASQRAVAHVADFRAFVATIPAIGARVRVLGGPLWSAWKEDLIGTTGTIHPHPEYPEILRAKSPRLDSLWFVPDAQSRASSSWVSNSFVLASEVEILDEVEAPIEPELEDLPEAPVEAPAEIVIPSQAPRYLWKGTRPASPALGRVGTYTTLGTRLSWSTVTEWLEAACAIARRAPSAIRYANVRNHFDALPAKMIREASEAECRALLAEIRNPSSAWNPPPRGARAGTVWERVNVEAANRLQRLAQADDRASFGIGHNWQAYAA